MSTADNRRALIRAMPWVFVLIWSTGFVVARFGMPHAPPLTFLSMRYALSLVCFLIWVWLARVQSLVALIIIGREIAISALREWMAQIGASRSVAVHMLGKLKTTAQMVAIPFLLYDARLFGLIDTHWWGTRLMWIAAVLTVWSMAYYLRKAIPEIRAKAR